MEARDKKRCEKRIQRHETLKGDQMPYRDLWQQISEYFAPRKATITVDRFEADLLDERLYDDTGKEAAEDFASGCVNYMFPAGEQWASFEPDFQDPTEETRGWFIQASKTILELMATSGFYLAIHEDLFDSGVFGTADMQVDVGKKSAYKFDNVRIGSYCVEVNEEDIPDIHYKEYKWTTRQCVLRFGEDNLHDSMLRDYRQNDGGKMQWDILHVVYPREQYTEGLASPENRPYGGEFIDMTNYHMLGEDGYYENPYIVSRMYKTSDSYWGYSLGMRTLPKVRQLNQMEEDKMLAAEKRLDPPWLAPDEGSYQPTNEPGGVNYYKATLDPRHRPEQLDMKNDVHTAANEILEKQHQVRASWFSDMFQMFANRPEQKTATEVLAMMEEKLVLFTPFFARYTREKADRILHRCFAIALREGYVEPPPNEVVMKGGGYKVTYSSRIALALKLFENRNLFNWIDIAVPMADALDPSIRHVGKWREILRRVGENLSVDTDLMNDEDAIVEQLQRDAAMEEAAQASAVAVDATKAMQQAPQAAQMLTG